MKNQRKKTSTDKSKSTDNQRSKTLEEFVDEIKDRRFILLLRDAINQISKYQGIYSHRRGGIMVLGCEISNQKRDGVFKFTKNMTLAEIQETGYEVEDFVLKEMYDLWKKGLYNI